MGGYACVPTALAAAVLGRPGGARERRRRARRRQPAGGRFARAAAVAFDGHRPAACGGDRRPGAPEIVAAAHPDAAARAAARDALGLPADRLVVAVVGGSLGSQAAQRGRARPGRAVGAARPTWRSTTWWAGATRPWAAQAGAGGGGGRRGPVLRPGPLRGADGALLPGGRRRGGRAGANTVAELAVVGVPVVLVPLPGAPGDHQTRQRRGPRARRAAR